MDIGWPTNVRHIAHVTFDRFNGFSGLPVELELEVPSARCFFFNIVCKMFVYSRITIPFTKRLIPFLNMYPRFLSLSIAFILQVFSYHPWIYARCLNMSRILHAFFNFGYITLLSRICKVLEYVCSSLLYNVSGAILDYGAMWVWDNYNFLILKLFLNILFLF